MLAAASNATARNSDLSMFSSVSVAEILLPPRRYDGPVTRNGALEELIRILSTSADTVAFTGAGISAPSGLSTFRSEAGIWSRFPVEEYGTTEAFRHNPERSWELFGALEQELQRARPNPAHEALAELDLLGVVKAVVTQNIDGLHQQAGSREVVEYHGSATTGHCPRCGRRFRRDELPPWPPAPRCQDCSAVLRPDVVLFGDPIPPEAALRAEELLRAADTILVVGSTLEVMPASWLVFSAARRGAQVAVVDPNPSSAARSIADLVVPEPAEVVLPATVDQLRAGP